MIDAVPDVSSYQLQPPALIQPARKKKSGDRGRNTTGTSRRSPNSGAVVRVSIPRGVVAYVGLVLILSDSDEECTLVAQDTTGTWLCEID